MKYSDLKYLIAYITPLIGYVSLVWSGWWSYAAIVFMFGLVPIVDMILPMSTFNHDEEEEPSRATNFFFDALLYSNLPILYFLVITYFITIGAGGLTTIEIIGKTLSIGFIVGALGINVAHEIGHRPQWYNQWFSRLLLLPALYLHFNIEHNRGHHKWVATPKDPATSRYGENFYSFWRRTVVGSFVSAWKIASSDAVSKGKSNWSLHNQMIRFMLIQLTYLIGVGAFFGWTFMGYAIVVAISGFSLLESVNYIEHYGLERKKLNSGRYEAVQQHHSWNSNHEFGRILLYELTRHSDHHFKSTRKYQILRHFDESPQMPLGYPGSMLLALIPPLWFKRMHKHPVLAKTSQV